jgi:hypothetical protein
MKSGVGLWGQLFDHSFSLSFGHFYRCIPSHFYFHAQTVSSLPHFPKMTSPLLNVMLLNPSYLSGSKENKRRGKFFVDLNTLQRVLLGEDSGGIDEDLRAAVILMSLLCASC